MWRSTGPPHDAFNARDWDRMRSLMSDDVSYVDNPRGLTLGSVDEFLGWLDEWTGGMSDARVTAPEYLDAGTHSICRFQGRGTNDGQLGPANVTGRQMDLPFCEILEVEGDQVVSGSIYYDQMTMMVQFGLAEAPAPA